VRLAAIIAAGLTTFLHTTVSAQNAKTPAIMFEGLSDQSRLDSNAIYLVNANGTNLKRLMTDGDGILKTSPFPQWSPDGQQIAYVNRLEGLIGGSIAAELYPVDRDGANRRLLMHVTEDFGRRTQSITGIAWSPDGKTLAVTRLAAGLFLVPLNKPGEPRLVFESQSAQDISSPVWLPNRNRIAFYSHGQTAEAGEFSQTSEVHVVNDDGSAEVTVGRSVVQSRFSQHDIPIHWSADGSKVFFPLMVSDPYGTLTIRAYVSNADSSEDMQWTQRPAYEDPSPDGSRIAFAKSQPDCPNEIFVMNKDGSGIRRAANDPDWACTTSTWSPDGQRLVLSCHFVSDQWRLAIGCSWRIFVIAADNSPTKLTPIIDRDALYPSVAPVPWENVSPSPRLGEVCHPARPLSII
jgi:Tol biopolymer transport system component